jgi:hypothetical protein
LIQIIFLITIGVLKMKASKTVAPVAPVEPALSALGQQAKAMLGEPIPANPVLTVSKDEGILISALAGLKQTSNKKNQELCDKLYSNGKRSHHFVGKSEKDKSLLAFRDKVCGFIVDGLDDDSKKLIRSNPESLSKVQIATRKVLIEDAVDNTYNNIKKAMLSLETAKASGNTGGKKKPATQMVMALREILAAMNRLSEETTNPYASIADDIKALKALNIHKYVKDTK